MLPSAGDMDAVSLDEGLVLCEGRIGAYKVYARSVERLQQLVVVDDEQTPIQRVISNLRLGSG